MLWPHIGSYRKKQIYFLLFLIIASSFAEVVSLGAVLPFLGIITAPDTVFASRILSPYFQYFNITSPGQLLLPLSVGFGLTVVFANILRFFTLWLTTRLSFAIGFDLTWAAYRKALYQPYTFHAKFNSSVISSSIGRAGALVYGAILPALNLMSAFFMAISILVALAFINWFASLVTFGGIGIIYICMIKFTNKRLAHHSKQIAEYALKSGQSMQEGMGGIRDILLDGTQEVFLSLYSKSEIEVRRSAGSNMLIANAPHYGIETLGVLLIIAVAYMLALEPRGVLSAVPILGALALGAQRLMPVLQKSYAAWTEIRGNKAAFIDAVSLLNRPIPPSMQHGVVQAPIPFQKNISLKGIHFSYDDDAPYILKNLDLEIPKGSCIGFIGKTGSGKSTLLDLVMGLLEANRGELKVDNVAISAKNLRGWQAHIAHVPQTIFLSDSSIASNIAFGVPEDEIDYDRVRECIGRAQLAEMIEKMPNGFNTFVGERGIRLSGGQRQRIGIARALYKRADVLIFDEATSALDNETEGAVMESIFSLVNEKASNLTILIIAHRLSTLSCCSQIVKLDYGEIVATGTYSQMVLGESDA